MAHTVPSDFKPSHRIYSMATQRKIPISFVDECVSEFIFYFQTKKTRRMGWDLSYWNWVKRGWSMKKEKEKKTVGTNSAAFKDWEPEKIIKSTSTTTLKQRLREL